MTGTEHGPDADVIVVGAGPVGLLLAGEAATGGLRVTVLEQRAEATNESRASILHARTMELFAELGLLDRLGPLPKAGPSHFGGMPLDLEDAEPGHPYAGQWKCPQTRIENALGSWAVDRGARLLRGHAVTGLSRQDDVVEVTASQLAGGIPRRLTSTYVVGCDGERSSVGQLAGFRYSGRAATREMLRADVAGLDLPVRRLRRYPKGVATSAPWADGTTRLMVHVYGRRARTRTQEPLFAEICDAWEEVTGEDIRHGRPLWLNAFDDTHRQADSYADGPILLAGDAAHAQMPIGGQALNLGLQDAVDLGRRLVGRVRDGRRDEPDGYHAARHPVAARALTHLQAQAELLLGGPEADPVRAVFAELTGFGRVRRHLGRLISGLDAPPPGSGSRSDAAPRLDPSSADRSSPMDRLSGKTALVTGSSRGIGRATAVALGRQGALVAVHYAENETAAKETTDLIEKDGGRAFTVRARLGAPGDVHELFLGLERGLKARTGSSTLDILVNNAGETSASGTAPEDVTPEEFDQLFAVNAKAPFFLVQRALPLLPEGGRIVNISSGLTRVANPEQLVYAMTKGAIEQLSLHFARHLAPRNITVNSVAPGITDNGGPVFQMPEVVEQLAQLSAFKRVGKAEDVADVVAFLASDEARWITGAFIDASGGTLLG
ncbi:SDR family oxidoreductase [Streptomyces sp. NPDC005538]|uniref:SDR family oxidoreductase n=1 Tax=unclassified Streptomyces TaxID=2593676 RepID=UPI0033A5FDE7